ncbi:glutathione ABC transporter substrate-binding protein GsiB [Halolamina pelagica]|uniref:Glutathione ABC transporter substrate-binding protein GsiB n=2 Tax=Halolamina pelagica TaxID=699431 RepID=A0A0N8I079_9EURY|nr:glutathione ABC transporter substrate-binding protein GsiB [Halolamina pelagica]
MTDNDSRDRISRRRYLETIGVTGTGVALAGCTSGSGTPTTEGSDTDSESGGGSTPSAGGTFVIGSSSKASTLDLHKATRRPEQTILSAIHEPMFRINPELEPEAHLASDWSMNDDATEYVFTLEEGITFHNGDELDAEEVVWSWERFVENSPQSYLLSPADSFEATGDYEVTVSFNDPYPLLPRYLTNPLTGFVSRSAVEDAENYGQDIAVGTGPYTWESWERGTAITVSRYEEYDWAPDFVSNQGPGYPEEFRFEHHPEATTLLNELTDGGVHGSSYITLTDTGEVESSSDASLVRKEYTRPGFLAINTQKEPTDNVNVRRAINHAVNKQPVIEAALGGEGYPIWSIVPEIAVNGLSEDRAKELGEQYSQSKARELLEQEGWTNSSEGETRTKNGEELTLTFYAFTIPRYAQMGEVIAPMLGEVGINAELEVLEAGTLYNNLESGNHHITTMAYGGNWAVNATEPILLGENTATEGGTNYSLWQNDEFDELLNRAKTSPDEATREEAITEAQELILEEAPVTPICAFNKIYGYKNEVAGMDNWTEHDWWPDQEWMNRLELGL